MKKIKMSPSIAIAVVCLLSKIVALADWPCLHHNASHTGFVQASLTPPYRLAWVRHFQGERMGAAMEPIVVQDKVFVTTHNGSLYALDAKDGQPLWRFHAQGAFLHSPAWVDSLIVAGNTDGCLYAIDSKTGKLRWSSPAEHGGFSASPVALDGTVFIGTRAGDFLAVKASSGKIRWRQSLKATIRQTAAVSQGRVYVTSEDLRVHCLVAANGEKLWASDQLPGQTARDYYPVVVEAGGRIFVIVRTNPMLGMGNHIGRDRHFLCQNAGVDDSGWQKVDAWIKSAQARGDPELWAKEQKAITGYLQENRLARTFFVFDAATGKEAMTAPVLWIAGCQGVGAMPALTSDGRLLVFYRSAYGNWNHGVAPLVALGLLDLVQNRITPLEHQFGKQPAWNTFWGTADESQNFSVAGDTILIVHQGTLSGFSLNTSQLFRIWGERDTYGGFRSPPWARNEWHGPGRGSVAVAGNRIYWLTGSRLLCLASGEQGRPADDRAIDGDAVPTQKAPAPVALTREQIRQQLNDGVSELLSQRWAPLFVEPGLSGRDFSFDNSGEVFEALAWCHPHLSRNVQERAALFLAEEWTRHPPFAQTAWFSLKEGAPREFVLIPDDLRSRFGQDKPPHPFSNTYAIWLYAERCGEWKRVLEAWPQIKECFNTFTKSAWRLDGAKGDLYANRYLASLMALTRLAEKAGDTAAALRARALADETADVLVVWWQRAASRGTLTNFKGSAELDPFIGSGDGISLRIAPHRHKVALLRDLTPEVAKLLQAKAPEAATKVWAAFDMLYRTWPLTGEERQVHFGENYIDPPDLAMSGFKALAWLKYTPADILARHIDLPFCRADLYFLTKLGLCLE